jgi:hypothetical protein
MFSRSSSSWRFRRDGVDGLLGSGVTKFDGDKSIRVGGCTRIALVIARTGLGCGIGNSPQVDVA